MLPFLCSQLRRLHVRKVLNLNVTFSVPPPPYHYSCHSSSQFKQYLGIWCVEADNGHISLDVVVHVGSSWKQRGTRYQLVASGFQGGDGLAQRNFVLTLKSGGGGDVAASIT